LSLLNPPPLPLIYSYIARLDALERAVAGGGAWVARAAPKTLEEAEAELQRVLSRLQALEAKLAC
jgi:hypothetical protein